MPDLSGLLSGRAIVDLKVAVAAAGAAVLAFELALRRAPGARRSRRLCDALFVGLGLLGALCWWNLFQFHFDRARGPLRDVHLRDVYHYYLGAKYFPELGYTRLYECTALAEIELGHGAEVLQRVYRNLETNLYERPPAILAGAVACAAHFSAPRFEEFKHDVAWFRERTRGWRQIQLDWGYNATPVWGMLGSVLANTGPASVAQIRLLTLLDSALLVATWLCVWWAFGWRTLCVGLLFFGTNFPGEYGWWGGGFLRLDWLLTSVLGICLLRRGRPALAGAALGTALLQRIVPGVLLGGLGLKALARMARARRLVWSPAQRRLALGVLAALALLLSLGAVSGGGLGPWRGFVEASRVDSQPSTNNMGLKTVLAYRHETRWNAVRAEHGRFSATADAWNEARLEAFAERRALFYALAAGYLLLLALAVERQEDWVAAVLGTGAMAVLFELSCYYHAILLLFALLWVRYPAVGVALCLLSAAQWLFVRTVGGGQDEQYTAASLAAVVFVIFATAWVWARGAPPEGRSSAVDRARRSG